MHGQASFPLVRRDVPVSPSVEYALAVTQHQVQFNSTNEEVTALVKPNGLIDRLRSLQPRRRFEDSRAVRREVIMTTFPIPG
jgi:hypothetical protein